MILLFLITLAISGNGSAGTMVQDDTVKVMDVAIAPVADGDGSDACWSDAKWQTIDQVWIPYGASVPGSDYSGRYKTVWSSAENVLYFLVEITDDIFVDGYVYSSNPSEGGGYPDFDIIEIFIDENRSRGLHVFDGTGNVAVQWGSNAENAFSYHIAAGKPQDNGVTASCVVCDIAGTSWSSYTIPNFASHFPSFALKRTGNVYTYELALKVYSDAYNHASPEASRVTLSGGKVFGLSLAYCDNDDPAENPKSRDNFFGSVWVPEAAYNDHWMNADGFGTAQLVTGVTAVPAHRNVPVRGCSCFPNPAGDFVRLCLSGEERGEVDVRIYDLLGREIRRYTRVKEGREFTNAFSLENLASGMYFIVASVQNRRYVQKVLVSREL
ncbi:MAG: T9SS type A sorting domain-containing protein [Methanomicrobiales archaeon]|nr:T9SS type A sorting domain-containing protein [Methanomicrobiales archaeon]